uniref:Uncharacterized protein n=1 Tax=viral metagenome TaxID=1070528 RepID=A0A6C0JHD0_9ZZZZ
MFDKINKLYQYRFKNPFIFALTAIVELILLLIVLYKWKPLDINEKYPQLAPVLLLIFGFFQILMYVLLKDKQNITSFGENVSASPADMMVKITLTILTMFAVIGVIYGVLFIASNVSSIMSAINYIIITLAVISGVAIILLIFRKFFKITQNNANEGKASLLSLIGHLFMYLPCLLLDFVNWVRYQYNITTKPVWILLGVELFLYSLTIIIPAIVQWFIKHNGKLLLNDPVYIDKETTVGDLKTLYGEEEKRQYKYCLSGWFWINPQPPNTAKSYTRYANILTFGDKPAVQYNSLEHSLKVTCNIHDDKEILIYETNKINLQAWNNIVINYDGGTMDIFINNELVASKPGVAYFQSFEKVTVGEENGIQGSVANIIYYPNKILSKKQIEIGYKAYKSLSTPVILE